MIHENSCKDVLLSGANVLLLRMITSRFVFYLAPQFSMMSLLPLTESLRKANEISGRDLYDYSFVSEREMTAAVNGMTIATSPEFPRDRDLAAVVICASYRYEEASSDQLTNWLRWLDRHGVPIGVTDTGIFLALRAGIRWDAPMCTHWLTRPALQEIAPDAKVSDRYFEYTPQRFSCAGATAGLDLMQHMIGLDHGAGFAARVGSHLIFGGDAHRSEWNQSPLADYSAAVADHKVRRVLQMMEQAAGRKDSVGQMAEAVGLSQSQLNRRFKQQFKQSPAHVYQVCRLRRAHALLKSSSLSVEVVAYECGFASRSQFTEAFKAEFGATPSATRGGYA